MAAVQYNYENDDDVVLFTYPGQWPKADQIPDITDDDSYTVYMCISRVDDGALLAEYFNSVYHPQFRSACRELWSDLLLRCPMDIGQRIEMDTEPAVRFSKRGDGFVVGLFTKTGYAEKKGWPESFQRRIGFRMVNEMFEIIDENAELVGMPGTEAEIHRSLEEIAIRFDYHSAPTWGYETDNERKRQEEEAAEDARLLRDAADAKRNKRLDLTRQERQGKLAANLMPGLRSTVRRLDPTTLLAHLAIPEASRKEGAKEEYVRTAFAALDVRGDGLLRGADFGSLLSLLLLHQNGWQATAPTDLSEVAVSSMLSAVDPSASGQLKAEELIDRLQSWSLEECAQLAEAASVYALESQQSDEGLASKRAAAAAGAEEAKKRGGGGGGGGMSTESLEQITRVVHQMGLAASRLTRIEDALEAEREKMVAKVDTIVTTQISSFVVAMAEQHYSVLAATMFAYSDSVMTRFATTHGVEMVLQPLRIHPKSRFIQMTGARLVLSMVNAVKGRAEQEDVELRLADKHAVGLAYAARTLHKSDAELVVAVSELFEALSVDAHQYGEAASFLVRAAAHPVTELGQRGAARILLEQRDATTRGDAIHEATSRALHFLVSSSPVLARLVRTLDKNALVEERVMYRGRQQFAVRANFNDSPRAVADGPQNAPMGSIFRSGGGSGGGGFSPFSATTARRRSSSDRGGGVGYAPPSIAFATRSASDYDSAAGFSAATKAGQTPSSTQRSVPAVHAYGSAAEHAVMRGTHRSERGMMRHIATKALVARSARARGGEALDQRVPRFKTSPSRQTAPPPPVSWRGQTRAMPRVMEL